MAIMLILGALSACGSKSSDGKCALQCGGAIHGSNDYGYGIRALTPKVAIVCTVGGDGRPSSSAFDVELKFFAYQQRDNSIAKTASSSGGTAAGFALQTTSDGNQTPEGKFEIPVPSLAFGVTAIPNIATSQTPSDEYCSDACGVITYKFAETCPAPGTKKGNTVFVMSGPLKSESVDFSVETPKPE